MSEVLVEDGATFPSSVTVPEDGDARNAASVVTGFQALADRTRHLYKMVTGVFTFADVAEVVWKIAENRKWTIDSDDVSYLELAQNVILTFAGGGSQGRITEPGQTGRIPRKVQRINVSEGSYNPLAYSEVRANPSGPSGITITVRDDIAYQDGDHFEVINLSADRSVTVALPGGAASVVVPPRNSTDDRPPPRAAFFFDITLGGGTGQWSREVWNYKADGVVIP
jgi:hypothetical protein